MSVDARELLERLLEPSDLSESEAGSMLSVLIDPEVDVAAKSGLLIALRAKGETPEEVRGLAMAMRAAAVPMPDDLGVCVDTCGTGGDGSSSFNVSTSAALVLAAAGLRVAKHGNRSVSSRSGSADVLEAVGMRLPETAEGAVRSLREHGFAFLFAPVFHPATRAVVPVRRGLRVRTVFNLLGPLTNPARPTFQLIGAYSPSACDLIAHALAGMDVRRAFVVHGHPGWDEATPCGPFDLWEVVGGRVVHRRVDPLEYGIERCAPEALRGGDAQRNAELMRELFAGRRGPLRDAVVLNAALVLQLVGRAAEAREAARMAAEVIDGGHVSRLLGALS